MRTITIGDSTVNQLGYGAMRLTGEGVWGPHPDHENALAVLKRAVELGINFIDTADAYGPNVNEELIHEALHPYDGLLIATKAGNLRDGPNQWRQDGRPEHIREAVEGSLERLGVDQLQLYQYHWPDSNVPYEDSVRTFFELQNEGKVEHVGVSNVNVEQLRQAMELGTVASVQNNYSVLNRQHEDVLDLCREHGIVFIPYFPIGGGDFGQDILEEVAKKYDATARQIGLAWLLQHYEKMLPIPGTSSLEHLEENVKAADITLSPEDIERLNNLK